jgi:hypothetical protein
MVQETHAGFEFFPLITSPADCCFGGTARTRLYTSGMNEKCSRLLFDPDTLLERIQEVTQWNAQTKPSDYFIASQLEVKLEAQRLSRRRGIPYRHGDTDLSYLLLPREVKAAKTPNLTTTNIYFSFLNTVGPEAVVSLAV